MAIIHDAASVFRSPTISIADFLDAMRRAHGGEIPLNPEQRQAIDHGYQTPLWIVAGPGTGKTHTLVWLVLKRILVDGIPSDRVFLTTFTRKAAAELQSRLILSRQKLIDAGLDAANEVDIPAISMGTLHALCSRVLQEHRFEPTFRIRVLEDELTQQFFIRQSRNPLLGQAADVAFWKHFGMVSPNANFAPNQATRATKACTLFNRLTENSIDPRDLRASGDEYLALLAEGYDAYREKLRERGRCDQAHLQQHFLDFLDTDEGQAWLGSGFTVLVDEYQDTNPIQETIYFSLSGERGDLTVVGDDDQSLYRFRGATVESLIDFDRASAQVLERVPMPVYLHENRRSHPKIVAWVNRYIQHHPEMQDPRVRVRAPGKPPLTPRSSVVGPYPAVLAIAEEKAALAAAKVASTVRALKDERLVQDYGQIALLSFSTKEGPRGLGPYTAALRDAGVPVYNPRNKAAQKDQRLLALLGALSEMLDPDGTYADLYLPRGVPTYVQDARAAYRQLVDGGAYPELARYVGASIEAIRNARFDPSSTAKNYLVRQGGLRVTLSALVYKLLALEPFASDLSDAEAGERIKALHAVMAEYESIYSNGELKLEQDDDGTRQIRSWDLSSFYGVFVEGVHDGLSDPEDDEVSIQEGMVNVMTIHQSKGLEFEVVIVLKPDFQPWLGETHILEDLLDPYARRLTPPGRRPAEMRAAEDAVRLFFVAYSRAKRLLVLAGDHLEKWDRVLGRTERGEQLNARSALAGAGVRLL